MSTTTKTVDALNALLRGELSAVETYRMALEKAKTDNVVAVMSECMQCHDKRANKLRNLVVSEGGEPTKDAGAWGAFAKAVEGGAAILGEKAALGSIKEGEDHGIELYKSEVKHIEGPTLSVVQSELCPAQEKTQHAIAALVGNI
jgi:hypothetical protein